jgi:hypothetical protein
LWTVPPRSRADFIRMPEVVPFIVRWSTVRLETPFFVMLPIEAGRRALSGSSGSRPEKT